MSNRAEAEDMTARRGFYQALSHLDRLRVSRRALLQPGSSGCIAHNLVVANRHFATGRHARRYSLDGARLPERASEEDGLDDRASQQEKMSGELRACFRSPCPPDRQQLLVLNSTSRACPPRRSGRLPRREEREGSVQRLTDLAARTARELHAQVGSS